MKAILAAVNNRKLDVATKYQMQLPVEYKNKLRMKIRGFGVQCNASKAASESPVLSKVLEAMDVI